MLFKFVALAASTSAQFTTLRSGKSAALPSKSSEATLTTNSSSAGNGIQSVVVDLGFGIDPTDPDERLGLDDYEHRSADARTEGTTIVSGPSHAGFDNEKSEQYQFTLSWPSTRDLRSTSLHSLESLSTSITRAASELNDDVVKATSQSHEDIDNTRITFVELAASSKTSNCVIQSPCTSRRGSSSGNDPVTTSCADSCSLPAETLVPSADADIYSSNAITSSVNLRDVEDGRGDDVQHRSYQAPNSQLDILSSLSSSLPQPPTGYTGNPEWAASEPTMTVTPQAHSYNPMDSADKFDLKKRLEVSVKEQQSTIGENGTVTTPPASTDTGAFTMVTNGVFTVSRVRASGSVSPMEPRLLADSPVVDSEPEEFDDFKQVKPRALQMNDGLDLDMDNDPPWWGDGEDNDPFELAPDADRQSWSERSVNSLRTIPKRLSGWAKVGSKAGIDVGRELLTKAAIDVGRKVISKAAVDVGRKVVSNGLSFVKGIGQRFTNKDAYENFNTASVDEDAHRIDLIDDDRPGPDNDPVPYDQLADGNEEPSAFGDAYGPALEDGNNPFEDSQYEEEQVPVDDIVPFDEPVLLDEPVPLAEPVPFDEDTRTYRRPQSPLRNIRDHLSRLTKTGTERGLASSRKVLSKGADFFRQARERIKDRGRRYVTDNPYPAGWPGTGEYSSSARYDPAWDNGEFDWSNLEGIENPGDGVLYDAQGGMGVMPPYDPGEYNPEELGNDFYPGGFDPADFEGDARDIDMDAIYIDSLSYNDPTTDAELNAMHGTLPAPYYGGSALPYDNDGVLYGAQGGMGGIPLYNPGEYNSDELGNDFHPGGFDPADFDGDARDIDMDVMNVDSLSYDDPTTGAELNAMHTALPAPFYGGSALTYDDEASSATVLVDGTIDNDGNFVVSDNSELSSEYYQGHHPDYDPAFLDDIPELTPLELIPVPGDEHYAQDTMVSEAYARIREQNQVRSPYSYRDDLQDYPQDFDYPPEYNQAWEVGYYAGHRQASLDIARGISPIGTDYSAFAGVTDDPGLLSPHYSHYPHYPQDYSPESSLAQGYDEVYDQAFCIGYDEGSLINVHRIRPIDNGYSAFAGVAGDPGLSPDAYVPSPIMPAMPAYESRIPATIASDNSATDFQIRKLDKRLDQGFERLEKKIDNMRRLLINDLTHQQEAPAAPSVGSSSASQISSSSSQTSAYVRVTSITTLVTSTMYAPASLAGFISVGAISTVSTFSTDTFTDSWYAMSYSDLPLDLSNIHQFGLTVQGSCSSEVKWPITSSASGAWLTLPLEWPLGAYNISALATSFTSCNFTSTATSLPTGGGGAQVLCNQTSFACTPLSTTTFCNMISAVSYATTIIPILECPVYSSRPLSTTVIVSYITSTYIVDASTTATVGSPGTLAGSLSSKAAPSPTPSTTPAPTLSSAYAGNFMLFAVKGNSFPYNEFIDAEKPFTWFANYFSPATQTTKDMCATEVEYNVVAAPTTSQATWNSLPDAVLLTTIFETSAPPWGWGCLYESNSSASVIGSMHCAEASFPCYAASSPLLTCGNPATPTSVALLATCVVSTKTALPPSSSAS